MNRTKFTFLAVFYLIIFFLCDFALTFTYNKIKIYISKDISNYLTDHNIYHHEIKRNYNGPGRVMETNTKIINTNSFGLKSLTNKNIDFSDYKNNYIFLGDSITEGVNVNYKDTFAGILSEKFSDKGINIINLSATSYSPVIYYRKTKYFVENYDLKFSKMFLFYDISDPYDELYRYDLKNDIVVDKKNKDTYLEERLNFNFLHNVKKFIFNNTTVIYFVSKKLKDTILGKSKEEIEFFKKYIYISNLQTNRWTFDSNYFNEEGFMGIEISKKYLLKLKDILDAQEAELTILVYPWPGQIYRDDKNSLQVKIWKEWAKNNNIKFINLSPLFFENGHRSENDRLKAIDKFYLQGDMHFNENGHKIIADYLWKELSINPN